MVLNFYNFCRSVLGSLFPLCRNLGCDYCRRFLLILTSICMKKIVAILVIVMIIIFSVVTFFINPLSNPIAPKCPVLLITGLKCPGCGTQQAIHQLLHGNFFEAFKCNHLIFFLVPLILLLTYFEYFNGKSFFPNLYRFINNRFSILILFSSILLYTIIRNL